MPRMPKKILALVSEPISADALRSAVGADTANDADETVLFTHPGDKRNWLEEGLVDQAKERFSVPVRHMVVD
jgi:hypothetical protein